MENISKRKLFNIIATVLVIGAVATLSLLFLITALFASGDSISEDYFDGSSIEQNIFSNFDNACLKNPEFYSIINRVEYKLFSNVISDDAIGGYRDFLFKAGTNKYGYNYLDDYAGEIVLSEQELEYFYQYIEIRRKAYENSGCDYILAVIPNTQSVYSENMPDYMGDLSENTMLSQIGAYLAAKGFENFIDLTDTMTGGKKLGRLYNNTENSINSLGAYVAYRGIADKIKKDLGVKINAVGSDFFEYSVLMTDGKSLAKSAGLASFVKNKTISIANTNKYVYTLVSLFGELESTYTKYEYSDLVSTDATALIEFTNEWDKVQMMPYFSSTFARASYRIGGSFSLKSVNNAASDVVIQVIREDELYSILDPVVVSSYNDGLQPGQHPYQTAAPASVLVSSLGANKYCITGIVEDDADITIFGDGVRPTVLKSVNGRFFASVEVFSPELATQICISVKSSDKSYSKPYYILLDGSDFLKANGNTFVGVDSMLYDSDYGITKTPYDSVINAFVEQLWADINRADEINDNRDMKVIFSVIPEKISVYNQGLDETLNSQSLLLESISRIYGQRIAELGVNYVDLREPLREITSSYKLFEQTGNAITDIGSYYAYRELMKYIDGVEPPDLNSNAFTFYTETKRNGELLEGLGFGGKGIYEDSVSMMINGTAKYLFNHSGDTDIAKSFMTEKPNSSLPVAVVVRDGQSDDVLRLMAESFSVMYVLEKGESAINDDVIEKLAPDYLIYLYSESNLYVQ